MDDESALAPFLRNPFKDRFHLARREHVERHHDRRLDFACERFDVFLRLLVEIGHREFRAERPERLGASPGDRILVGDADDEAFLAFEELGLTSGIMRLSPSHLTPFPDADIPQEIPRLVPGY